MLGPRLLPVAAAALATLVALSALSALLAVDAPAAPSSPPCSNRAARAQLTAFTRDLTAGRAAAATRRFAPEPAFQWYSADGPEARHDTASMRRDTLRAYFAARAAQHETLALRASSLRTFHDPRRGLRHFDGRLTRSADDLARTGVTFKGALRCATRGIVVWSMG